MRNILWFLLGIFLLSGCSSSPSSKHMPKVMPSDFEFVLKYGVMAKNEVNTFNDTITKDMIVDPPITSRLVLTENDMREIYDEMRKIDIMSSPNVTPNIEQDGCFATPHNTYRLKIQYENEEKEIEWSDANFCSLTQDQKRLNELQHFIRNIIENKEEYKKLPEPQGGYS